MATGSHGLASRRSAVALGMAAIGLAVAAPLVLRDGSPSPAAAPDGGAPPSQPAPAVPAVRVAPCLEVSRRPADAAWRWDVVDVGVDLDRCALDVARAGGGTGARLADLLPQGALAAVNGGYFEADFRPTSWLRVGGADVSPRHATRAGGVLAVRGATPFVGSLADLPFEPELAVQNAPLVVEPDGAVGIRGDDGKRAARTVACMRGGGLRFVLVLAPGGDGPTLLELARWVTRGGAATACDVALNLDGGPSTGIVFAPGLGQTSSAPRAPIAYSLVVRPRP